MLAQSRRFLFVHIPKTGGNSIQNILRKYSEDEVVCLEPHQDGLERFEIRNAEFGFSKHTPLSDYRERLPAELYSTLIKFCCVRNPWERAVSFYFSPHRQVTQFSRQEFIKFIPSVPPMTYYLRQETGQGLEGMISGFDQILRFESLQSDFNLLCDRLNIPREILPVRNKSTRGKIESYYDDETIELVREAFSEDIEGFDYRPPGT